MNPEDNNPLSNSFAVGGMTGGQDTTPSMNGVPMPDTLASAQDSLTAAGMAANQGVGAMSLDEIAANDSTPAALPPVDEPLVPAAPVPGSIGSAVSVPPVDPVPAPSFGAPVEANQASSGPVPAPEVAPSPTPFNPFATPSTATQTAPNPAPGTDALGVTPTPQTTSTPQPAPAPVPMGMTGKPKTKPTLNPLVAILGVLAALLFITSVTFFILWNSAKNDPKVVYVPSVSDESSNSAISILSCSRNETYADPAGSGTTTVTISYTGDKLSAYSSVLSLGFADEAAATAVRDAYVGTVDGMSGLVGGTLSVSGEVNGNNYAYSITSQDGTDIAESDAMNAIYGTSEGEPSLALSDVQAKYEADGFVCVEE